MIRISITGAAYDAVAALPLGSARDGLVAGAVVPSVIDAIQAEPSETAKMIDIAQVQGQVHAQSVQKVGELADKNPRETISIIRQWLTETAAA